MEISELYDRAQVFLEMNEGPRTADVDASVHVHSVREWSLPEDIDDDVLSTLMESTHQLAEMTMDYPGNLEQLCLSVCDLKDYLYDHYQDRVYRRRQGI